MLTVGVDLAAQPKRTAVAVLAWRRGGAIVRDLVTGVDDVGVVDLILSADKAGLDVPLGWPDAFVDMVADHRAGRVPVGAVPGGDSWRRSRAFRATDEAVWSLRGRPPLSVSTNLLGVTAMRAVSILARLQDAGVPVDRAGGGRVVEVYPAATLAAWGLPDVGYKGKKGRATLGGLVDLLAGQAPWLDLADHRERCRSSDDAFDAVIAGLTARAAAIGRASTPRPDLRHRACREGWIAVPTGALAGLVDPVGDDSR